jgi:hypothetical protein
MLLFNEISIITCKNWAFENVRGNRFSFGSAGAAFLIGEFRSLSNVNDE